jgi:hypothetical protein
MRLGLMQPYFFPYVGHFALIEKCNTWVVLDSTQYTPQSWMNRNRVLHPSSGWTWLTVPVEHLPMSAPISAVRVKDVADSRGRALRRLAHYRGRAPFYDATISLLEEAFSAVPGASLVDLNVQTLSVTCRYLGLDFSPLVWSRLGIDIGPIGYAGAWAPAIAEALGADEYINPIAGRHLFQVEDFAGRGIDLQFLDPPDFAYATGPYGFEAGLSILDAMMWNSPEAILSVLRSGEVLAASGLAIGSR